jgi:hypothetical protein
MKYQSALTLPIAAACLVFLGPNFAAARIAANTTATGTMQTSSTLGRNEAMRMVAARADLTKKIDAKDMRAGQEFQARLYKKVQLKNGPLLPKGTMLVGKVVNDRMNQSGNSSTLTLRFTQADLKDGKTVPIKATIVGLYSGANQFSSSYMSGPSPNYWTPKTLQVDQINALHKVDLHSRIAANNSGVLKTTKSNIEFSSGTEFALAIAKRGNEMNGTHAMRGMGGGA